MQIVVRPTFIGLHLTGTNDLKKNFAIPISNPALCLELAHNLLKYDAEVLKTYYAEVVARHYQYFEAHLAQVAEMFQQKK